MQREVKRCKSWTAVFAASTSTTIRHCHDRPLHLSTLQGGKTCPGTKAAVTMRLANTRDPESGISDLESRISDLGSRISSLGSRISNLESRVSDLGSQILDLESRVSDLGSRISDLESRISDLRSRISSLGSRISNSYASRMENNRRRWYETIYEVEIPKRLKTLPAVDQRRRVCALAHLPQRICKLK